MNSPVNAFSTTSTCGNFCSKLVSRELPMCASSRPSPRSTSHLPSLAVANTSAPRCFATWIAAMPTPPAPAWTRTFSPGRTLPSSINA